MPLMQLQVKLQKQQEDRIYKETNNKQGNALDIQRFWSTWGSTIDVLNGKGQHKT